MSGRWRLAVILLSVAAAVVLWGVAMALYPGGNWEDPTARGHDFARNFLCDLGDPIAQNGVPNPVGSVVARVAMSVLAVGLAVFWWELARFVAVRRILSIVIRFCGLLSAVGMLVVPLPGMPWPHPVAVYLAAIPGVIAISAAIVALSLAHHRWLATWGVAVMLVALIDSALYAARILTGASSSMALTVLQRAATILYLSWIVVVTLHMRARA